MDLIHNFSGTYNATEHKESPKDVTGYVLMLGQKSVEHAFTVTQHIRTWSEVMYLKEYYAAQKFDVSH